MSLSVEGPSAIEAEGRFTTDADFALQISSTSGWPFTRNRTALQCFSPAVRLAQPDYVHIRREGEQRTRNVGHNRPQLVLCVTISGPSMKKSVYLSSTFDDLKEYRIAAAQALRRMKMHVNGMEDDVAADERPADRCLEDVSQSDIYIGIFAHRYGYVPAANNPQGKAITELEYRKATECRIPRLIFLLADDAPWNPQLTDKWNEQNDGGLPISAPN